MPHVTIGVPIYNGEKYLDDALGALCAQTYQDLEIFISDNGSTDGSTAIIKKWAEKDSRIKIYHHDKTLPVLDHFVWVIKQSTSKWFCYAAYDDLWSENYIQKLVAAADKKGDALVSIPRTFGFEEKGKYKDEKPYLDIPKNASQFQIIQSNFRNIKSAVFYALYDREFLANVFYNQDSLFRHTWGTDFQMFLNFLFTNKVVGSNDAIFYQRYTGLSDQRYRPKTAKDQWLHYRDFWREILRQYNNADLNNLSPIEKMRLIPTLHRYANNIVKPRRIVKALIKNKGTF